MNEAQRQFYLKQCGITLWYARSPLPGAAASRDFDFALPDDAARPAKGAPASNPDPVHRRPSEALMEASVPDPVAGTPVARELPVSSASAEIGNAPVKAKQAATPEPSPRLPVQDKTTLAVDLRIVETRRGIIVAQLGDQAGVELQERLLAAICQAVDADYPADSVQAITWPVFSNPAVPGNGDSGLGNILRSLLGTRSERPWLGLGLEIDQLFTLVAGGEGTDPGQSAQPREVFPHHLGALAASGQLKRELWQLISQRFIGIPPTVH